MSTTVTVFDGRCTNCCSNRSSKFCATFNSSTVQIATAMKIPPIGFLAFCASTAFSNNHLANAVPCSSSIDCTGEGQYCAADGTCYEAGTCSAEEDCGNFDNIFAATMCVGTMYCIGDDLGITGVCINICNDTPPTCSEYGACDAAGLEGNCCPNDEGKFLACCAGITIAPTTTPEFRPANAQCSLYTSCVNAGLTADVGGETQCCPDDDGDMLACCYGIDSDPDTPVVPPEMGSECSAYGSCVKAGLEGACCPNAEDKFLTCCYGIDNDPEKPVTQPSFPEDTPVVQPSDPVVDPGFGVDPPVSCSADTDCVVDKEYCAQGTCASYGTCISDIDCMNPSNLLLQDKRCKGYQYCNDENQCDRMCGEPCFGGTEEAVCTVTGCDTKILCPGSVSCVPNYCDDCKGIYFDTTGSVITGCSEEDVVDPEFGVDPPPAEENPVVQPSEPAEENPVVQPSEPAEENPVVQPSEPAKENPVVQPSEPAEDNPVVQPSEPAEENPVVQPSEPAEENPVVQPSEPAEENPVVQPSEPAEESPVVQPSEPAEENPVVQPSDPVVGVLNKPALCSQKPSAAQDCIPECGGNPGGPGCDDVDDSSGISLSSFAAIILVTVMGVVVGPLMML